MFYAAGVPLTIGIVPYFFGTDPTVLNPIQEALQTCTWRVEIAANGYMFENFGSQSLLNQTTLLADAQTQIQQILGVKSTTFIPPNYSFDSNTITALHKQGFTCISSSSSKSLIIYTIHILSNFPVYILANFCSFFLDSDPATYINDQNVFHFPAGAMTADATTGTHFSAQETWSQALAQLSSQNFSVVALDTNEFTNADGSTNSTMVNELGHLLTTAQTSGKLLVLVSELMASFGGLASTASCHV